MANVDPKVIAEVNLRGEKRLAYEVEKQEIIREFAVAEANLKAAKADKLNAVQARIDEMDESLHSILKKYRKMLVAKDKQSFATISVKFQWRKAPGKTKIADPDGFMKKMRQLGQVKKVAKLVVVWKLDQKKALEYIEKDDKLRKKLRPYLEITKDGESLSIQPNGTYVVVHDSRRISPPSVKIEEKS